MYEHSCRGFTISTTALASRTCEKMGFFFVFCSREIVMVSSS